MIGYLIILLLFACYEQAVRNIDQTIVCIKFYTCEDSLFGVKVGAEKSHPGFSSFDI